MQVLGVGQDPRGLVWTRQQPGVPEPCPRGSIRVRRLGPPRESVRPAPVPRVARERRAESASPASALPDTRSRQRGSESFGVRGLESRSGSVGLNVAQVPFPRVGRSGSVGLNVAQVPFPRVGR